MSLPDDVPFDRRYSHGESVENMTNGGRRQGYRRKEDVMLITALHNRRRAAFFSIISAVFAVVGVVVLIYLGAHQASINKSETFHERESRIQNVSQLCNGVNEALDYINFVVTHFANKLPPPPHKLNCTVLIANTAASR